MSSARGGSLAPASPGDLNLFPYCTTTQATTSYKATSGASASAVRCTHLPGCLLSDCCLEHFNSQICFFSLLLQLPRISPAESAFSAHHQDEQPPQAGMRPMQGTEAALSAGRAEAKRRGLHPVSTRRRVVRDQQPTTFGSASDRRICPRHDHLVCIEARYLGV